MRDGEKETKPEAGRKYDGKITFTATDNGYVWLVGSAQGSFKVGNEEDGFTIVKGSDLLRSGEIRPPADYDNGNEVHNFGLEEATTLYQNGNLVKDVSKELESKELETTNLVGQAIRVLVDDSYKDREASGL